MLGKTHIVLGIIAAGCIINTNDLETNLIVVGASIVGSLMPDIDHRESIIRKTITFRSKAYHEIIGMAIAAGIIYKLWNITYDVTSVIAISAIVISSIYAIKRNEHRGYTHSIIGICIYGVGVYFLLNQGFLPFVISYAAHLAADFLTNSGIQIFYPCGTRICLGLFNTNSVIEKIIYWVGLAVVVIIAYNRITEIVKLY